MKYIIMIAGIFISSCASTPDSNIVNPLLEKDLLICPHGTFTYCKARNPKIKTCECVKSINFHMDGFSVPIGAPF